MEIVALLQCVEPYLGKTNWKQLCRIIAGMLAMTGRVTMKGLSRWTGSGGSYRTIQRFFYTCAIPWANLFWIFFKVQIYKESHEYLFVGDETVTTKAGKKTHGLDYFYASLYEKAVRGLSFFALSLVDVQSRRSFPIRIEQVTRGEAEKASKLAREEAKKRKASGEKRPRGRPKGSKNKNKAEVGLGPELSRIKSMIESSMKLTAGTPALKYILLDGHFGNKNALQMTKQCGLYLVSKLRHDSVLFEPYAGEYSGKGRRSKYGNRIDYSNIPDKYLKNISTEGDIQTKIYQAELLHKEFNQPLNIVIISKANLKTKALAHAILFSDDLALSYEKMIDFYALRFQIEFNFRDAKQFWGLEDFMNVSPTAVTNFANFSFFMVNLSHQLLSNLHQTDPDCSILDLKAYFRGYRYVEETLKMLPQKPEPILLGRIFAKLAGLGRIHPVQQTLAAS